MVVINNSSHKLEDLQLFVVINLESKKITKTPTF